MKAEAELQEEIEKEVEIVELIVLSENLDVSLKLFNLLEPPKSL